MAVLVDVFRQELRKLGWIEGKNITIEYRFTEQKRERLPELTADLVRLQADLIVVTGGPEALAAKKATTTIPIVMVRVGDPVAAGLVASLARPGGNVTGFSSLSFELASTACLLFTSRRSLSMRAASCPTGKTRQTCFATPLTTWTRSSREKTC
jgi:ABC-type uncharacterized transport system substrate-binding protein